MKKVYILILVLILGISFIFILAKGSFEKKGEKESFFGEKIKDNNFIVYIPDLSNEEIKMYWKDKKNKAYSDLSNFIKGNSKNKINFATNGGIYSIDYKPKGLYIENYKRVSEIDLGEGEGNFYMQPNGVFYIQNNKPEISETRSFKYNENISYAVQSGPMLIKDGVINKNAGKDSKSLKIRSAVGIDRENNVFFLMSSENINFYNFSKYALDKLNCRDLLFLDGTISKMYFADENEIPEQNYPFVVIITSEKN